MAVRSGNRYVPRLRASKVTPRPRRSMAVGGANVLELDGVASLERPFAITLDCVVRVTRSEVRALDTLANIRGAGFISADVGIRVRAAFGIEGDTAIRTVQGVVAEFGAVLRITGTVSLNVDLCQAIRYPLHLEAAAAQRIYAVLRREDHLILT